MRHGHPFCGRHAAITTMHGKAEALAPVLEHWFGITLESVTSVDTDQLGAFTGEIPRAGSMLDAARAKARLAIERSDASIGLGSEGAFGPHPIIPFVASGIELIVLIDAGSDHEIVVSKRTRTNYDSVSVALNDEISGFLERVGFPAHALVVRPEDGPDPFLIEKGLADHDALRRAIERMASQSKTGRALAQTDMRAHVNPTRMKSISFVAKALAVRMARLCPRCGAPGFGLVDVERGLRCEACEFPTRLIAAEIHGCGVCDYRMRRRERPRTVRASQIWCDLCNP